MMSTPSPHFIDLVSFISRHAHDLRSPFNRIMGFTKIILKGQDGPVNEMQKEDLNTIFNNSLQAFRLINSLIDMARLLKQEKQIRPAEIELAAWLEQVATQWKRAFPDKPVALEISALRRLDQDRQPTLVADAAVLQQAVLSALAYAVEWIELPANDPAPRLVLTVETEAEWTLFRIESRGQPARSPSQVDLEAQAVVSQALVGLLGGEYRQHETNATGARLCFALPAAGAAPGLAADG